MADRTLMNLEETKQSDTCKFYAWNPSNDPDRFVSLNGLSHKLHLLKVLDEMQEPSHHVFRLGPDVPGITFLIEDAVVHSCSLDRIDLNLIQIMVHLLLHKGYTVDPHCRIVDCRPFAQLWTYFGGGTQALQHFLRTEIGRRHYNPLTVASLHDVFDAHGVSCIVHYLTEQEVNLLTAAVEQTVDPFELDSLARLLVRTGYASTLMAHEPYVHPDSLHSRLNIPAAMMTELDPLGCMIAGGAAVFAAAPENASQWPLLLSSSSVEIAIFGPGATTKIEALAKILTNEGYTLYNEKGSAVATAICMHGQRRTIQLIYYKADTISAVLDTFDLHFCMVAHDGLQGYVTAAARGALQTMTASTNLQPVNPSRFAKAKVQGLRLLPDVEGFLVSHSAGTQEHKHQPFLDVPLMYPVPKGQKLELSMMSQIRDEYRLGSMGGFTVTSQKLVDATKINSRRNLAGLDIFVLACPFKIQLPTMTMVFSHDDQDLNRDSCINHAKSITSKITNKFNKLQFIRLIDAQQMEQMVVSPLLKKLFADSNVQRITDIDLLHVCYTQKTQWFQGGLELKACPKIQKGQLMKALVIPQKILSNGGECLHLRFFLSRVCL